MLDDVDREPTSEEMRADRDMLMSAIGEALGDHLIGCGGPEGMTSEEWDELFSSMGEDE